MKSGGDIAGLRPQVGFKLSCKCAGWRIALQILQIGCRRLLSEVKSHSIYATSDQRQTQDGYKS